ncbi:hypothetical protein GCM10023322_27230 [Rugosimonospora acidiphila]|uniref:Transmembrane protein n=1 Tax=Rugosimonospora acidiphila TaxID=556531 RepID=A0ABP9RRX7_9ACTN
MKVYADVPAVRIRQLFTDLFIVVWLWFWIRLAVKLYDLVLKLAVPGRKLSGAGDGMAGGLSDAGSTVDKVPGLGGALSAPFNKAADAARSLADVGREQVSVVHDLAWAMSLALLAGPVIVVVAIWLPLRLRWIRRASSAAGLRSDAASRDLLALRALANQPLRRLGKVNPDPVAAWRSGDPETVDALAALELRRLGVRMRAGSPPAVAAH